MENIRMILRKNVKEFWKNLGRNNWKIKIYYLGRKKY
jgi:hypothetical protein